MELRLDIQAVAALARAWEAAPEIARRELTAATWEAELLLQREIVERTPRGVGAGGGLAGSISAREPELAGEQVLGQVGTALAYAEPVELGSRPHRPPIEPIEDWVRAKLGKRGPEARGMAFAIAHKVAQHGTPAVGMFAGGLAASEAQIAAIYQAAQERIAAQLGEGAP